MEMIDSRRLTGPNLVSNGPGAVLEVKFEADEHGVAGLWREEMRAIQSALGWHSESLRVYDRPGGAWLVASGPIDQLYTVIESSELAWKRAVDRFAGIVVSPVEIQLESIREMAQQEANPAVIALQSRAADEGVTFLWDDDHVSLGLGTGSETWSADDIPSPDELNWKRYHDIPLAVVTGTNGKSTNVRLLNRIVSEWGKIPGTTSTDWIRVGDEILDAGDYSGPGGARTVLRDQRVEVGILELARGGLLRRGAGVMQADVALITNVAEEHMGQYGMYCVDDLIEAKMIVARLVQEKGLLVLNADDEGLVRRAQALEGSRICWFGCTPGAEMIRRHVDLGGSACLLDGGTIVACNAGRKIDICRVTDIPITLGGRATYNVYNCLSATAMARALSIPTAVIRKGLTSFESNPESNPGRGNYFSVRGATVLLDFAHNTHGLNAILEATATLTAGRRLLTVGTAGDRQESEIRALARAAAQAGLDRILVTETLGYERELGPGGVPRILYDELMKCGVSPEDVEVFTSEMEGVKAALKWAKPGDMIILLVKSEREKTLAFIREQMRDLQ